MIPANGWFEWMRDGKGKRPFLITAADEAPLSFAGLWGRWERRREVVETFTVLTTEAHPDLAEVHARQPAVIASSDFGAWLNPDAHADDLLALARTPHPGPYKVTEVGGLVNNVLNDGPGIVAPVADAP